jgi:predicted transposase YbfD/YdcC
VAPAGGKAGSDPRSKEQRRADQRRQAQKKNGRCGHAAKQVPHRPSSKQATAQDDGKAVRNHWGIENGLHWQLDVTFWEDSSRVQSRHGAKNFALLRKLALPLLKQHPLKESIACKCLDAALDANILEGIVQQSANS